MSLFALIKEDFATPLKNDPAIKSKFELFFNYPGLIAIVHYRIAHFLYQKNFRLLARIIMGWSQFLSNIDIHPAAQIGRRIFIDHGIGVVIGETAIIGDDVTIYQGVSLGGVSLEQTKRHPTLESGVVIGAGAKILGDITIGKNAKIGANSVVIKDVPAESTAVGIPARIIPPKIPPKHTGLESQYIDSQNDKIEHKIRTNLPDVSGNVFLYLLQRIEIMEQKKNLLNPSYTNCKEALEALEKLQLDLDKKYEDYIKALKMSHDEF